MPVFQLYLKHSVGKCFNYRTILFNKRLFSHRFWERKDNISQRKNKISSNKYPFPAK
jgi:hypothetical protein